MTLSLQALLARLLVLITALLNALFGGLFPGVTPGSAARDSLLPAGASQAEYTVVEARDGAGVKQAWPDYKGDAYAGFRGVGLTVRPATGQVPLGQTPEDLFVPATKDDLNIGVGTPCNGLSEDVRAEGSSLMMGATVQTDMYCEPSWRMEAENWLVAFWSPETQTDQPRSWSWSRLEVSRLADGNVKLSSDRGTLILARVA